MRQGQALTTLVSVLPVIRLEGHAPPTPKRLAGAQEHANHKIALGKFLRAYSHGTVRLAKKGIPDQKAIAEVDRLLARVAKWNDLVAAKLVFEVATIHVEPPTGANTSMDERVLLL